MSELLPITSKLITELRGEDYAIPIRALIVEDDDCDIELMSQVLRRCNCDYDVATDGAIALKKMESTDYRIIFLDLNMPRMDGLKFLDHIKRLRIRAHVVIVTGSDMVSYLPKDGYYGVVRKPLTEEVATEILSKTK